MRTIGLIRAAARGDERDLLPRLRAGLAAARRSEGTLACADERVRLELPAFSWSWRLATAGALAFPFVAPEPLRLLVASGLL